MKKGSYQKKLNTKEILLAKAINETKEIERNRYASAYGALSENEEEEKIAKFLLEGDRFYFKVRDEISREKMLEIMMISESFIDQEYEKEFREYWKNR